MKKFFLSLVVALLAISSVNAEEVIYGYPKGAEQANSQTLAEGVTVAITGNASKNIQSANSLTVNDSAYTTLKLSNGAQNTLTLPKKATSVTFYSYINYNRTSKGSEGRTCYWKEVNGVSYTADDATILSNYNDLDNYQTNPDVVTFTFTEPTDQITFTNTGEQLCYLIGVNYAEAAQETAKVSFSLPYRENVGDVVESVVYNISADGKGAVTEITGWPTGDFEANVGQKMQITLNVEKYTVDSVLVNGEKVEGQNGVYTTTINEFTSVEIFAYTGNVNGKIVCAGIPDMTLMQEYASVYKQTNGGMPTDGKAISIKNGTTKFTVPSYDTNIVIVPAEGKSVYVAVNNVLVDANANTGYFNVKVSEGDEIKVFPALEFSANPENGSTVDNIDKVTLTFPGFQMSGADYAQAIYDNAIMDAEGNYVKNENGENIKGTLTWGDDMNQLVWQGGNKVTTPGTYTVVIPAGALRFGDVNIQPLYITYTIAEATPAQLQMTYPQANTTVNELPDYVTFMFDKEVPQPYACAIQNGYNDPIVIEPVDITVIDGNTVKIVLTDKVKEQLGTLTADGVTVYVQLTETQQYDTHFTVAPEFAVESSTFTSKGGQIIFNQNCDLVDYDNVKCYVSAIKTKNIATQATLSLDDDNYAAINVTFADELEAGEYTLDIPEGMIKSTAEEPLASVKVAFSVEAATTEVDLTKDMYHHWTAADMSGEISGTPYWDAAELGTSTGIAYGSSNVSYLEYADITAYDKLVITSTEGTPRAMFNRVVDGGTVQVETPRDAKYYAESEADGVKTTTIDLATIRNEYGFVHLHAIKGANWANTTITSMKLVKEGGETTAISNIENKTNTVKAGKYIINGKLVIVKNGKQYNMNGQVIK